MQAGAAERVAALQQHLAAEKQTAAVAQEASSIAAAALAEAIMMETLQKSGVGSETSAHHISTCQLYGMLRNTLKLEAMRDASAVLLNGLTAFANQNDRSGIQLYTTATNLMLWPAWGRRLGNLSRKSEGETLMPSTLLCPSLPPAHKQ